MGQHAGRPVGRPIGYQSYGVKHCADLGRGMPSAFTQSGTVLRQLFHSSKGMLATDGTDGESMLLVTYAPCSLLDDPETAKYHLGAITELTAN